MPPAEQPALGISCQPLRQRQNVCDSFRGSRVNTSTRNWVAELWRTDSYTEIFRCHESVSLSVTSRSVELSSSTKYENRAPFWMHKLIRTVWVDRVQSVGQGDGVLAAEAGDFHAGPDSPHREVDDHLGQGVRVPVAGGGQRAARTASRRFGIRAMQTSGVQAASAGSSSVSRRGLRAPYTSLVAPAVCASLVISSAKQPSPGNGSENVRLSLTCLVCRQGAAVQRRQQVQVAGGEYGDWHSMRRVYHASRKVICAHPCLRRNGKGV